MWMAGLSSAVKILAVGPGVWERGAKNVSVASFNGTCQSEAGLRSPTNGPSAFTDHWATVSPWTLL